MGTSRSAAEEAIYNKTGVLQSFWGSNPTVKVLSFPFISKTVPPVLGIFAALLAITYKSENQPVRLNAMRLE